METCHYDRGHWPCSHCYAKSPDSEDACCRYPEKEEKIFCPLCMRGACVEERTDTKECRIICWNFDCLEPSTPWGKWEEVYAKWKKYAR